MRAAVPVNPRGKREARAVGNVRRQLKISGRAVKDHGLSGVAGGVAGRADGEGVVRVAGAVERVGLELQLHDAAAAAGCAAPESPPG